MPQQGLYFSNGATGETGWLMPVGWTPVIAPKIKPLTDLSGAHDAEPVEGGKRGHVTVQGIPIAIENPAGTTRSGVDEKGTPWSVQMVHHYGFVKRTCGADGEGVDCFVGPNPESNRVFIVNQVNPHTRAFDEHKVMLGWDSEAEAKAAYHANYSEGWTGFQSIAEHSIEDFRDWLQDEGATRTIAKGGDHDPIPEGAHWLTMHPNGPGTKGVPILVQPVKGSKGVGRVIGGAGSKLNGLRLHGLKDAAQYKEESRAGAAERREAEAKRKASLTPEQKEQEKGASDEARAARKKGEDDFIQKIMGTATGGQGAEQGGLFDEQDPKKAKEIHRELLKEAKKIAAQAEKKILLDAEARGASGMSLVGGDAPVDLDQILTETQGKTGVGYDQKLAARAEANGMTSEKLMTAVAEIKGKPPKEETGPADPQEQAANIEIHKATKELAAKKASIMREAVKASLENNQNLAEMLAARKALRDVYKQQIAKKKGISKPVWIALARRNRSAALRPLQGGFLRPRAMHVEPH